MLNSIRCSVCDLGESACICDLLPKTDIKVTEAYHYEFALSVKFMYLSHNWHVFVADDHFGGNGRLLLVRYEDLAIAKLFDKKENDIKEQFSYLINKYVMGAHHD